MDVLSVVMFGPAAVGILAWTWKHREALIQEYSEMFTGPVEEEVIELDIHAQYWEQVERSANGQFATRGE